MKGEFAKRFGKQIVELFNAGTTNQDISDMLREQHDLQEPAPTTERKVRRFIQRHKGSYIGVQTPKEAERGWDETGDKATNTFIGDFDGIPTEEKALAMCDADLDRWEVIGFKWKMYQQHSIKKGIVNQYSIALSFKRKEAPQATISDLAESLCASIRDMPSPKLSVPKKAKNGSLVEVCIYDLHYEKLCWADETGENYDTKIATKRAMAAVNNFIQMVEPHRPERFLFAIGNDYFHSDTVEGTTTAGTPLDVDGRWQKSFTGGVVLLKQMIETMALVAPVDAVVIQGNHDWTKSFYAGEVLKAHYRNNNVITIDNRPMPRKYYQYGKNLIGMTHGNNEKHIELPLLMAQEEPRMWADTKYREFHLGHLHHSKKRQWESTAEQKGVVVRHIRSLAATDAWHNQKGFKGAVQSAEAFVWDKDNGLRANLFYNV